MQQAVILLYGNYFQTLCNMPAFFPFCLSNNNGEQNAINA